MSNQEMYLPSFYPAVQISREKVGVYDVAVVAIAPNSCYSATKLELTPPPGIEFTIPEHSHLVCHARYDGGSGKVCLMWRKPLHWLCEDLEIDDSKSHIHVHILVDGSNVRLDPCM